VVSTVAELRDMWHEGRRCEVQRRRMEITGVSTLAEKATNGGGGGSGARGPWQVTLALEATARGEQMAWWWWSVGERRDMRETALS
jgi:hypothetical protein